MFAVEPAPVFVLFTAVVTIVGVAAGTALVEWAPMVEKKAAGLVEAAIS